MEMTEKKDKKEKREMNRKGVRLWVWIAGKCRGLGCYSAATIADFIDGIEIELYNDRRAPLWDKYSKNVDFQYRWLKNPAEFLVTVSAYAGFMVGCTASGDKCEECEYGKRYSPCNEKGSLLMLWIKTFELEYKFPLDWNEVAGILALLTRSYDE